MLKRFALLLVMVSAVISMHVSPVQAADEPVRILYNDEELRLDSPPQFVDGRLMVPMRAVFERMGATVTWDEGPQIVGVRWPEGYMALAVGSRMR